MVWLVVVDGIVAVVEPFSVVVVVVSQVFGGLTVLVNSENWETWVWLWQQFMLITVIT